MPVMDTHPGPASSVPPSLPFHPVSEIITLTRMSKTWIYGEIRAGRLRTVMAGHRRMIPDDALAEWLGALPSGVGRSSGLGVRRHVRQRSS